MNNEEIFRELTGQRFGEINMKIVTKEQIYTAMLQARADERKKIESPQTPQVTDAIEFTEWLSKNIYAPCINNCFYKFDLGISSRYFKASELYELFKQEKNKIISEK